MARLAAPANAAMRWFLRKMGVGGACGVMA